MTKRPVKKKAARRKTVEQKALERKQARDQRWDPVKEAKRKGGYSGGEGPSWVGAG